MNVLLTSAGRRSYLVKYFKDAIGNEGKVFVCNSDERALAFKYADESIVSPLIYDDDYIPFLLDYCRKNTIELVVPLFDADVSMLSHNRRIFDENGIKVIVSDPDIIEVCNDKWKMYEILITSGFHVPKTFLTLDDTVEEIKAGKMSYPVVVKPRYGCGSIGVSFAYDEEDLRSLSRLTLKSVENSYLKYESSSVGEKVIYQEYLKGQEYGADIINNLQGENENVIIRKKLAMRAGETDIAVLVDEPHIKEMLMKLGHTTHHIANLDCDIILSDKIPYVIDLNARFGGGYPFSHLGGCNLPLAIIEWSRGRKVDKSVLMAKTGITGYKEILITGF